MARHEKIILTDCGKDRRISGYYSTPPQVAKYITHRLLEINPNGVNVIDPCVGQEELISYFTNAEKKITGIDINNQTNYKSCEFICADFLDIYTQHKKNDIFSSKIINPSDFDYWIANPPYNCHEVDYIRTNKSNLKDAFGDIGVHNMYSMFIAAIIDMAKDGSVIGIITLDSFLTSKAHAPLRKKIINETTIHDIILCPTSLFLEQGADVRTCIIIMTKEKLQNTVNLLNRPTNIQDFFSVLEQKSFVKSKLTDILLSGEQDNFEFMIDVPKQIRQLFQLKRVGELFKCITGISTGNDNKYLSSQKRTGFNVPFYKNPASRKFYCTENAYLIDSFLEESASVNNFMVRNVKLLFKAGITCSSMGVEFSACYLPPNSTFGVNPNIICDEEDIWWLLGYMNSDLVKFIVRGVLIRSNMVTSGYISRVPVPKLSLEEKFQLSEFAKEAYEHSKVNKDIDSILISINQLIYNSMQIDDSTQNYIKEFCLQIVKLT